MTVTVTFAQALMTAVGQGWTIAAIVPSTYYAIRSFVLLAHFTRSGKNGEEHQQLISTETPYSEHSSGYRVNMDNENNRAFLKELGLLTLALGYIAGPALIMSAGGSFSDVPILGAFNRGGPAPVA